MCLSNARKYLAWLAVCLAGFSAPAAGATCKQIPLTVQEISAAARVGFGLASFLDQTGAQVALVARVGTDQSKRGIRYTHAALSWRDHPQGRWHVTHLLNPCGQPTSELYDDGPVNFFLERPFSYDALVVIPALEVQARLAELLDSGAAREIHQPSYSAIAHPFETEFQNSNQWLLELIALAVEDEQVSVSREAAQVFLESTGFQPARMRLGFFERVGARRMDNVSLSDHRRSELRRGGYQWVSVQSIVRYLEAQGLVLLREDLVAN